MKWLLAIPCVLLVGGCMDITARDTAMEKAAAEFSAVAEQCLLDVRDRSIPYGRSSNCTGRLHQASLAYTNFQNFHLIYKDEAVPRHAYVAEVAKSAAWSAAALSNATFRNVEPIR